jgi:hypothetical protein
VKKRVKKGTREALQHMAIVLGGAATVLLLTQVPVIGPVIQRVLNSNAFAWIVHIPHLLCGGAVILFVLLIVVVGVGQRIRNSRARREDLWRTGGDGMLEVPTDTRAEVGAKTHAEGEDLADPVHEGADENQKQAPRL